MAIYTVDLPAHNAYIEPTEDLVTVVGGDGLETLANTSTSSYIRFSRTVSSGVTNGWAFRVGRGGSMLGFGLWTPREGATITDIRFVMTARLPGPAGGDIPYDGGTTNTWGGGTYESSYTNVPVFRWPMVMIEYSGAGRYYNFSEIATDGTWGEYQCRVPLAHVLFGSDYVIAGIGAPDTGVNGLCPRMYIDPYYPWPYSALDDRNVDLAYLAIRITYTLFGEILGAEDLNRGHFSPTL